MKEDKCASEKRIYLSIIKDLEVSGRWDENNKNRKSDNKTIKWVASIFPALLISSN